MKRHALLGTLLIGLFAQTAFADFALEQSHPAVLGAELTFGAAGCILGSHNLSHGYQGRYDLAGSLVGFGVGVTSLVLSADPHAEIPAFDVVAGMVSVAGALFRLPKKTGSESDEGRAGASGVTVHSWIGVQAGVRQVALRVRF